MISTQKQQTIMKLVKTMLIEEYDAGLLRNAHTAACRQLVREVAAEGGVDVTEAEILLMAFTVLDDILIELANR